MIRDRIVVGVRDERIQRRLSSEAQGQLTLKTAIEIALGMEAAAKNAQVPSKGVKDSSTSSSTTSTTVNKLGQKQTATGTSKTSNHKYKCWCCSGPHRPDECRFKESSMSPSRSSAERTVRLIRRLLNSLIKMVVTIRENSTIEVKEGSQRGYLRLNIC